MLHAPANFPLGHSLLLIESTNSAHDEDDFFAGRQYITRDGDAKMIFDSCCDIGI